MAWKALERPGIPGKGLRHRTYRGLRPINTAYLPTVDSVVENIVVVYRQSITTVLHLMTIVSTFDEMGPKKELLDRHSIEWFYPSLSSFRSLWNSTFVCLAPSSSSLPVPTLPFYLQIHYFTHCIEI